MLYSSVPQGKCGFQNWYHMVQGGERKSFSEPSGWRFVMFLDLFALDAFRGFRICSVSVLLSVSLT